MLYYMAGRVILFRTEHSRRSLVEQVDFVTSPGTSPDSVHRPGGPSLLITPKAVLEWHPDGWACRSIHPGSDVQDIRDNTGFALALSPPPPTTSCAE